MLCAWVLVWTGGQEAEMKLCRKGSERFVCCEVQYELMMLPGSQEDQKYPEVL